MDQHHDRFDAARLQLRHQCIHRLGFVAEFEPGDARGRDDARGLLQGQPDEGDGDALEFPDLVGRQHALARRRLDRGGREIAEFGTRERMRPLAAVDGVAAAILHPEQLGLALVELVVADRGDRKSHHRKRFDRGLVVKHRRQERACADQIARGDEDRVLVSLAQLFHERRHVFGPAGRHHDLLALIFGIIDADAAWRRPQIAVEIVDREDAQLDGSCGLGRGGDGGDEGEGGEDGSVSHETKISRSARRFHESSRRHFGATRSIVGWAKRSVPTI